MVPQNFPEGNHGGRAPGRASFDAVPQAAGEPARPGPAGLQVCRASAAAHDSGERLSESEFMLTFSPSNQFCTKSQSVGVFLGQRYRFLGRYTAQTPQRCN